MITNSNGLIPLTDKMLNKKLDQYWTEQALPEYYKAKVWEGVDL